VTVSDTGELPAGGGSITSPLAVAAVNVGGGLLTIDATAVNTTTSGGAPAGTPNSSRSQASVTNLNASVLGIPITATLVQANSSCQCSMTGIPQCQGSVIITALSIAGQTIDVTSTTSVNLVVGGVIVGQVFINEQTVTGTGQMRAITVNALRISLTVGQLAGTNIIISQAQSDINCAPGGPPTAAPVSITGRVLNSRGRGIFNAIVTLTYPSGQEHYTITNPFGYYRFDELLVGDTYVLDVRSKRYTFTPQVISVSEELTEFNLVAQE